MTWTTCFFRVENKVEFTFWCLRYIFTFIMFILGIKAPGISTVRDYYSRYTDAEVSLGSGSFFGRFITNCERSNRSCLTLFKYLIIFQSLVRNEEGQEDNTDTASSRSRWDAWRKFGKNMMTLMPCMY